MADSAELRTETTVSHHDGFPMQCWLGPRFIVLNVVHFSWTCYCLSCYNKTSPVRTDALRLHPFARSSHFLFLRTVNSTEDVCRWCSMNKKFSTVLSLHSNTRATGIVSPQQHKNYRYCLSITTQELPVLSLRSNTRSTGIVKVLITNAFWDDINDPVLLLSSALPTATNKFPKYVEQSMKMSYSCVQ
jgi:hypothetical protein